MIRAWILYYNGNMYLFEERDGTDHASTDPEDWGLPPDYDILLVLQKASFMQAWLDGDPVRKW